VSRERLERRRWRDRFGRHGGWSHPFFDPEAMGAAIGVLICVYRPARA